MKPYVPIRPSGWNVYGVGEPPQRFGNEGFYQPANAEEVERRRNAIAPFVNGEFPARELPLQVYQEWVELDWKKLHGTYEATERLMGKIIEEAGVEFVQASVDLEDQDEFLRKQNSKEFIDEAGDALWCTVAVASNAGVDVTEATRLYLRDWYLNPNPTGLITFGDVGSSLDKHTPTVFTEPGFLPPNSNPEDFVPTIPIHMSWFSLAVGNALDRQYGYHERLDSALLSKFIKEISGTAGSRASNLILDWSKQISALEDGSDKYELEVAILESYFKHIGKTIIRPLIGDSIVLLAYIAKKHGESLSEIAVNNVQKITNRVQTNTIDKTDNIRN